MNIEDNRRKQYRLDKLKAGDVFTDLLNKNYYMYINQNYCVSVSDKKILAVNLDTGKLYNLDIDYQVIYIPYAKIIVDNLELDKRR